MSVVAQLRDRQRIPVDIVQAYQALNLSGWSPWTDPHVLTQADVDGFVEGVGDGNVIHRTSSEGPAVVPGMLTVSALPRYLGRELSFSAPGFATVFGALKVDFLNLVLVGEPLAMQYFVKQPDHDERGPKVECEFRIRLASRTDLAVEGVLCLRFVPTRIFDALLKRARQRVLRAQQ